MRAEIAGGGGEWISYTRANGKTWMRTWRYIPLGDGTALKFEIHHYRPSR